MTAEQFLAEMTRRLPRQRIPDGPYRDQRPLALVSLEPGENWILGLLEAWALAGDVASFYLDRFAAEGYLGTAVEELSVHELIRMLGYPPRPGIAGTAWVAYTIAAAKGMPSEIELPRGAKIQSLPLKGQLPQLFELPAPLAARVEWNALTPALPEVEVAAELWSNATQVELAGARTQLKKGQPLLIGGTSGKVFGLQLRAVEAAKVTLGSQGASTTQVSWLGALSDAKPATLLEAPVCYLLRRRARLFGYNATPWDELPLPAQRQVQPILGGVLVSSSAGSWTSSNQGLPVTSIAALLANGSQLWAGTERGLYGLVGDEWQLTSSRPAKAAISALTASGGRLYAGTSEGQVLVSSDGGADWQVVPSSQALAGPGSLIRAATAELVPAVERLLPKRVRLPKAPVKALAVVPRGPRLLAAGDSGVFATRGRGGPWRAINTGLPGTDPKTGLADLPVRALAVSGAIFAATAKGVFRADKPGARWQAINEGLPGFSPETGLAGCDVLALAAHADRRRRQLLLLAGTSEGVFRRVFVGSEPQGPWRPSNSGLPSTDPLFRTATIKVSALVVASDPATLSSWTFAGTDQGLYQSADLGLTWFAAATGQPPTAVSALAVVAAPPSTNQVAAATAFDGFPVPDWPGWPLTNGSVDLAGVEEQVVPGSWIALQPATSGGGASSPALVLPVLATSLLRAEGFGLSSLVTRLSVPVEVDLSVYSRRDTVVLLDSQELPLASRQVVVPQPLAASAVVLSTQLEEMLPPQRPLLVSGRPIRLRLPASTRAAASSDSTSPARNPGAAGLGNQVGLGNQIVTALSLPVAAAGLEVTPASSRGSWVELEVETSLGSQTRVACPEDELVWLNADADEPSRAELAWVAGCENVPDATRISFVAPLSGAYDPQTVTILANAIEVVQGETVSEILGSGNASKSHQSFELSSLPLTYEPAADIAGLKSTLEVRVGGILWREVASFHGSGPSATVYTVRRDLAGRTRVVFGDGLEGARLPTGNQNVEARYKSGFWTSPLDANQLSLPRTRPLGVKGVTNPLAAAGGTPAETITELKARAPRATRPLGRIVSRTDFEDFALTFPGISRARLAELAGAGGLFYQITVAGVQGQRLEMEGSVLTDLEQAISRARLPGPRVVVASYRPRSFDLRAGLRVSGSAVAAGVVAAARSALLAAYSVEQASFGQVLASSQVLATLRAVPGVVDVELMAFFASNESPALNEVLVAAPAGWQGDQIVAAELLLIRADGGITLEVLPRLGGVRG